MTPLEIDQKISELRGEWDSRSATRNNETREWSRERLPYNWGADTHWPTLLYEMLRAGCRLQLSGLFDFALWPQDFGAPLHSDIDPNLTLGTKVCLAWLKWKGVSK